MDRSKASLPPGRGTQALTDHDKRSITETFRAHGYDEHIEFEEGHGTQSRFGVKIDGGQEIGYVKIGADIFPGSGGSPNSKLDMPAAVAHEITHYERWKNKAELDKGHLDEALTSLEAIMRCGNSLKRIHIEQLVADALQRLYLMLAEQEGEIDDDKG